VTHLCPRCGGTDHGRPAVVGTDGEALPWDVSFSRTPAAAAAAASGDARVGVDIESTVLIERHPVVDALLHPSELAISGRELARLWVAKEALLKATGDGLNVDLREIQLAISAERATVVAWPAGRPFPVATVTFFDVSDDIVGALAELGR
jgi:4'-phosphopantetheinyl transferase